MAVARCGFRYRISVRLRSMAGKANSFIRGSVACIGASSLLVLSRNIPVSPFPDGRAERSAIYTGNELADAGGIPAIALSQPIVQAIYSAPCKRRERSGVYCGNAPPVSREIGSRILAAFCDQRRVNEINSC